MAARAVALRGNAADVRARLSGLPSQAAAPAPMIWREFLASGQYGFVHRIKNPETGEGQAVKINFVERTTDFSGAWREVDMLTRLAHPYVIRLEGVGIGTPAVIPKSKAHRHEDDKMRQDSVYMLFELGTYDLDEKALGATPDVLRACAQALLALEHLHRFNHVHRDVKPGNLLYFEDTRTCKLIDFGMCKPMFPGVRSHVHAVTAAYRPPEMFLGTQTYGPEVDIWAMGMTLVYMLLKKEVDVDGDTPAQEVLRTLLATVPVDDLTPDQARRVCPSHTQRVSWDEFLEDFRVVDGLEDLLRHMVCWQPSARWSATQCLDHPVFDAERAMIAATRAATAEPPAWALPYTLAVEASPERDLMLAECRRRDEFEDRMVFHAMDYVDRYISWRVAQQEPRPEPATSVLRARVCMYLAFKYFNIMTENMPINEIWRGINKREAEAFETTLVRDVMRYSLYRPTMFEMVGAKNTKALREHESRYRKNPNGFVVDAKRMYA